VINCKGEFGFWANLGFRYVLHFFLDISALMWEVGREGKNSMPPTAERDAGDGRGYGRPGCSEAKTSPCLPGIRHFDYY
jgi:hypothetical protein